MKISSKKSLTPLAFVEKNLEMMSDCDSRLQTLNSAMSQELFDVRKKYVEQLTQLQEQKDTFYSQLQAMAEEYKENFFVTKKSMQTKYGSFGFRLGRPKFKLAEGLDWASVTPKIREILPDYVKFTVEPSKDKLMRDKHLPEVINKLPLLGISVVQEEMFFLDLNKH